MAEDDPDADEVQSPESMPGYTPLRDMSAPSTPKLDPRASSESGLVGFLGPFGFWSLYFLKVPFLGVLRSEETGGVCGSF